jgi:cell division protein FtsW (lipid II flippase)
VTWGGVAVAVIVAAAGIIVAAVRGRIIWIWPTLALVLIVAALLIGMLLANSVMHQAIGVTIWVIALLVAGPASNTGAPHRRKRMNGFVNGAKHSIRRNLSSRGLPIPLATVCQSTRAGFVRLR